MRQVQALVGVVAGLALWGDAVGAQQTGASFGNSRGFGGGGSMGAPARSSSSGGGASSGSSSFGSSSGSGTWGAGESRAEQQRREADARRDAERARLAEQRRIEEERLRQLEERRAREALARERALPPTDRARSQRFTHAFGFPAPDRASIIEGTRPPARGLAWWGGRATPPSLVREFRRPPAQYAGAGLAGLVFVFGLGLSLRSTWKTSPTGRGSQPCPMPPSRPAGAATVRTLSVGIDRTRRREVQAALSQHAGRRDLSTAQGMFAAWRDAQAVLKAAGPAVRYLAWAQRRMPSDAAQAAFAQRADDLRGRFVVETERGERSVVAPALAAREEEGDGMVVVSVVAGFDRACSSLPDDPTAAAFAEVLDGFGGDDPEALVALEVIWSPSRDEDRMSSAELEVAYPELHRLGEDVGRMVCAFCRTVWAKELGRCPRCAALPET